MTANSQVQSILHYSVNHIFYTIQGEGYFSGTPAIFIRLQGCPVGCSWCDTKYTWETKSEQKITATELFDKKSEKDTWAALTATDIANFLQSQNYSARHIVLTGGEPCLYDLRPLTEILIQLGYRCQVETSGTHTILCDEQVWVTLSAKIGMRGGFTLLPQALTRADEIKHPVARARDITNLQQLLSQINDTKTRYIALQPVSQSEAATKLCIDACMQHNWCISLQLHKYMDIA